MDPLHGLSGWVVKKMQLKGGGEMTKLGVKSHRAYYKPGEMIDLHARLSVYRNADEPLEDVYWTVMQPVL